MGDEINIDGCIEGVGIAIGAGASVTVHGDIHYYPIKLQTPLRNLFKPLIENCIQIFGGRGWAFSKVANFIHKSRGGYLIITAPAGFGKTTFVANLVSRTPAAFAYHFFTPLYGKDSLSEELFLRNVIEQITQWHAHKGELPDTLDELRALFQQLLDEPLEKTQVLILDGLDEVSQWRLSPYLSRKLPDHLHVIVTLRDVGQDWQTEFRFPSEQVTHLPLGGLNREEVAEVLCTAGELGVEFASDNSAIEALLSIAAYESEPTLGADPFYVKLLAEDVAKGIITTANVKDQPTGLHAYLNEWLQAVFDLTEESGESKQSVLDVIGTCIVALAPISRQDLEALHSSLRGGLFSPFPRAITRVRRFITGDDSGGYTLVHPRLHRYMATHPDIDSKDYLSQLLAH